MDKTIIVMIGGGIGAATRYWVGRLLFQITGPGLPWGTFTANVTGGLLMGLLAGTLARHGPGGQWLQLLLGVGVLGGYTTFSSFSLETVLMIERGDYLIALTYVLGSVLLSVIALFAGLGIARAMG